MTDIYGLHDVRFGDRDEVPNWRSMKEIAEDIDPDDEELEQTSDDVIAILGFDPKEFSGA